MLMKNIPEMHAVMTRSVHTIGLDQPISVVRDMMREHNIRHLPVQDAGKLVGVVTHRDVQVALGWESGTDKSLQVKDVYTPEPYSISPNAKITDALIRMEKDQLGCALVVEKGKLVGIFTTTDACRVLADFLMK